MDLFLLVVTCVVNLALGLVIFIRDPSKVYARVFLLLSVAITVWITSNFFTNHYFGSDTLVALSNRVAFVAGYAVIASALLFTYRFPVAKRPSAKESVLLIGLSVVTFILSATSWVAGDVIVKDGVITFTDGPLVVLYLLSFLLQVAMIIKNLTRLPRKTTFKTRQQARLILAAFVISALVGVTLNLVIPIFSPDGWAATRLGPISTIFLVAIIAYTIVKHGLFDIRTAIVRTAAYVLAITTVVGVYSLVFLVGLTNVLGFEKVPFMQQVTLLALAFAGGISLPQLVKFFDRVTSKIFFRHAYDFQTAVGEMTDIFSEAASLRQLLTKSSTRLRDILGAEYVTITLTDSADVTRQKLGFSTADAQSRYEIPVEAQSYMVRKNIEAVTADALASDNALVPELWKTKTAILIALRSTSSILGFVVIGYKQNGTSYTQRDINLLSTLSDEFTIAIQNMLRLKEITEFTSVLQHRIDEATEKLQASNHKLQELDKSKDEFISMASHQLRTPLTAVKGYISMMLEGDIGKVSAQQRDVLEQAYDSSQRMVFLIGDFLNVSRLQTGKFVIEPSTINYTELVVEEVDQLKDTARARKITLNYEKPGSAIVGVADENKLRQVMMNFIDNAIFYSPAGTSVDVQLFRDERGIVFKVNDHGIGVPKAEQAKLFTKFFRAGNARQQRPDGTGIGIYMAKKVIAAHGGTIIFESKEGVGSTFGFTLPLEYDAKKLDK